MDGFKRVARVSWTKRWLALILVSVSTLSHGAGPAAIPLTTDESVRIGSLSPYIQLLEDPSRELGIEDVSRHDAGFFDGTADATNVGFSSSAWWVRVTLRNELDSPRLLYLRQGYPLIDSLTLYEPTSEGGWKSVETGDRLPFSSRPVAVRDFLFPLRLDANAEQTFYLRFVSQGPVDIHLSLWDPTGLTESLNREQISYGLYFGCVLMLLVWSGLVFVAVRDQAFLAYFVYVSTFGIYMTVNTGFAFQYFWPDSPRWANSCLIMLLSLSLVTALQFSTTILRSVDYTPRLHRVARALQVMALLSILLVPFIEYAVLVQPVALLIFVSVLFMIALGVFSLMAGSRPARYYVIAWGALLAGSVIFLMKNFGMVPHTFISQHSWQVGALVEMILLSMTLSSRMNELKHQSRTDPLTLIGNRRLFDDRLPEEFAAARAEGKPLSLLMLDIDNFKAYNDRHGHALGDEAIKLVGSALRKHARKPVLACRYGGDEFCVILPGIDAGTAAVIAERLRATVNTARTGDLTISVSIGYASMVGDEFASHDKLFDAADAALYSAKEAGRNRVAGFSGRRAEDTQRSRALGP